MFPTEVSFYEMVLAHFQPGDFVAKNLHVVLLSANLAYSEPLG